MAFGRAGFSGAGTAGVGAAGDLGGDIGVEAGLYYSAKFYDLRFGLARLGLITALGVGLYLLSLVLAGGANLWANLAVKAALAAALPVLCYFTGALDAGQKESVKALLRKIGRR